ncbi:MAG: hypothetical protein WCJ37_14035 [Syntrophus sp. (in: bacteria)]
MTRKKGGNKQDGKKVKRSGAVLVKALPTKLEVKGNGWFSERG